MTARRQGILLFSILALLSFGSFAIAQVGPPGGTIYANDQAYQVIATPANFQARGNFDTIFALGHGLANVADAAPGDQAYNGGRWEVRPITWVNIEPTQFTNASQVYAASMAGDIEIGGVVRRFECPLIPQR